MIEKVRANPQTSSQPQQIATFSQKMQNFCSEFLEAISIILGCFEGIFSTPNTFCATDDDKDRGITTHNASEEAVILSNQDF